MEKNKNIEANKQRLDVRYLIIQSYENIFENGYFIQPFIRCSMSCHHNSISEFHKSKDAGSHGASAKALRIEIIIRNSLGRIYLHRRNNKATGKHTQSFK